MWLTRSGMATLSPTVRRGFSAEYGSWKTICRCRRTAARPVPDAVHTSWPSKKICPAVGATSRVTIRAVVVFPQPDSPTSPSVSPAVIVKSMPSTAGTGVWRRRRKLLLPR